MSTYSTFSNLPIEEKISQELLNTVPNIIDNSHKEYIITNNNFVCINTYAEWCSPCKKFAPKYVELCHKYNGCCVLVKENADLHLQPYKNTPQIGGVPAFSFYKHGEHVETFTGADLNRIENTINRLINID